MTPWPRVLNYKGREFCRGCLHAALVGPRSDAAVREGDEVGQAVWKAWRAHCGGDSTLLEALLASP